MHYMVIKKLETKCKNILTYVKLGSNIVMWNYRFSFYGATLNYLKQMSCYERGIQW